MRQFIIYATLAIMLASCASDDKDTPTESVANPYEMRFNFVTYSLSRLPVGGVYNGILPKDEISLSAYFTDSIGESQYYFKGLNSQLSLTDGVWKADGWYWPLQGNMTLFNYWIHQVSSASELTVKEMPDGTTTPALIVNATNLDGYHDFIYGAKSGYKCPQAAPVTLPCYHALSWLRLRLYTQVYGDDGVTYNREKSQTLKDRLKVNKLSIEDCSRRGTAMIMPDQPVSWDIPNKAYIRDQLYTWVQSEQSFKWIEVADASAEPNSQRPLNVTVGETFAPFLGTYERADTNYEAWGLLIVPQHKTAIVIDYELTLDNDQVIRRTERFELRENGSWLPGSYYNYDIVFRNYSDLGVTFDVIPTWGELLYNTSNLNFSNGAFGSFVVNENGTPTTWGSQILIDPMHDGGSAIGDDMDYKKGGTVF